MNRSKFGNLFLLHIIVFIFGFTGILGRLIETSSDLLVWWRMIIASASIALFVLATGKAKKITTKNLHIYVLVGGIIAIHWITFFESIKQSTVSVALACFSATSLFTAILEPLFFKRRVDKFEVFFGAMVIGGLLLIFSFESEYKLGIALGLTSAFLASLFTTLNGKFVKNDNPYRISLVELAAGAAVITLWFAITNKLNNALFTLPPMDWLWIGILGTLATAFAFVGSVKVMEELSPFTVSLTINLEPVYGIILAFFIFGADEKMTLGFYAGTTIILLAIYLNTLHRKRRLGVRG